MPKADSGLGRPKVGERTVSNVLMKDRATDVLTTLHNAEEELYVKQISNRTGIEYSHVFDVLNKLEEVGLIEVSRQDMPEKGKTIPKLSDTGQKAVQHVTAIQHLDREGRGE